MKHGTSVPTNTGPLNNNGFKGRRKGRKSKAEQEAYERQVREAYAFYVEGHSIQEVADEFGWGHADSVLNAFQIRELPRRPQGRPSSWTSDRVNVVKALLAEGKYGSEIAEVLGLSRATVQRKINELGLKRSERPFVHGTENAFVHHGCRCDACTAARQAGVRRRKEARTRKEPPSHGLNAYTNYGCRCDICTEAQRKKNREYYQRRQRSNA